MQVPKSGFKIMLRYLSDLQGRQRELSVQKAQRIVEQYGEEGQSSTPSHSPPPPPPQYQAHEATILRFDLAVIRHAQTKYADPALID